MSRRNRSNVTTIPARAHRRTATRSESAWDMKKRITTDVPRQNATLTAATAASLVLVVTNCYPSEPVNWVQPVYVTRGHNLQHGRSTKTTLTRPPCHGHTACRSNWWWRPGPFHRRRLRDWSQRCRRLRRGTPTPTPSRHAISPALVGEPADHRAFRRRGVLGAH